MSMKSLSMMPQLSELPKGPESGHRTTEEHLTSLLSTDRAAYAAEYAVAASIGFWSIFDRVNVDDRLTEAYQAQYPGLAAEHSLHEHWQEMMARGDESMTGFVSGLKGKVAEFGAAEQLEEAGWTEVNVVPNPTQQGFDITGINPSGEPDIVQVKTGGAGYAQEVQDAMEANPDLNFAVSSEIYDEIADSAPEYVDRMMDIGNDYDLVEGIIDGLETLAENLDIDVPARLGGLIPYAGAIIGGIRLIYSVMKTEAEFKEAGRTTKNKIQVVQTLTLMARIGIPTLVSAAMGKAGTVAGTVAPGIGNLIGGITGTLSGAAIGMYLNSRLRPHMLRLALGICGLEEDDLFYFKNKSRVDNLALSFQRTANQMAIS